MGRRKILWGNIFFVFVVLSGGLGGCGLLVYEYQRGQELAAEERAYDERMRLLAEQARLQVYDRIWQKRQVREALDSALVPSAALAQQAPP